MEPESPSPYPQVPATCPYPEPTPSTPHDPLHLPEDPSLYYSPIYVLVSPMASFPQASLPTPCAHLYPPPYASHALPVSFVSILPPAQYWVRSTDNSAPRYTAFSIPLSILLDIYWNILTMHGPMNVKLKESCIDSTICNLIIAMGFPGMYSDTLVCTYDKDRRALA